MSRRLLAPILAGALAFGCDDEPPKEPPLPPRPTGSPSALSSPAGSGAPAGSGGPAVSAAVAPGDAPPEVAALAGTWEGSYDAKKSTVEVTPPKDAEKTWAKDDGKAASGPGKVSLTVAPSGEVTGKVTGALGELSLTGKTDGKTLRASVVPVDPKQPPSMTGVLIGLVKDGGIVGEIKAAGPDASLVRTSAVELKKK